MKNIDTRQIAAMLMKLTFYIIVATAVFGFGLKIFFGQDTTFIAKGTTFLDILKSAVNFDSNGVFAFGAYLSAMFPFVFAVIVSIGYIWKKRYKGAIVWCSLTFVLLAALFLKAS